MAKRGILTIQKDGTGKEVLTTAYDVNGNAVTDVKIEGMNVKDYYKDQDYIMFKEDMNGLCVVNDSDFPLIAYVNGMRIDVRPQDVFENALAPFREVIVECEGSFRVFGLGFGGTTAENSGFSVQHIPQTLALNSSSTPAKIYRGTTFTAKQNRKLQSIGIIGLLTGWQIWEVSSDNKFVGTKPLAEATLTNPTTNTVSFNMFDLATPLQLTAGKKYIVIGVYVSSGLTQAKFKWKADSDYKIANNGLIAVENATYQDDVVPAAGVVIPTTATYTYQAKYKFGGA